MNTFGERLKAWAKKDFGGVGKLCDAAGINQPQMSRYISGDSKPSFEVLDKLAMVGADLRYLLRGDDADPDLLDALASETSKMIGEQVVIYKTVLTPEHEALLREFLRYLETRRIPES